MISVGLAWTLTMVSAYMMGESTPKLPPTQGEGGMTDAEVYDQIELGNPLGTMAFGQAVSVDPRRVEALVMQRVIRPFTLALTKLQHPNLKTDAIKAAMRHAYLERNHRMRTASNGDINACQIAEANEQAWKMNAEILRVAFEMQSPEAQVLKQLLVENRQDISRAFRESAQICEQAARVGPNEQCSQAWLEIVAVLKNMDALVTKCCVAVTGEAVDEDAWAQALPSGSAEPDDTFGALSFEDELAYGEIDGVDVPGEFEDDAFHEYDLEEAEFDPETGSIAASYDRQLKPWVVPAAVGVGAGLAGLGLGAAIAGASKKRKKKQAASTEEKMSGIGDAVANAMFGTLESEQHIVSGHRAPGVGLDEYRRMGGRVF